VPLIKVIGMSPYQVVWFNPEEILYIVNKEETWALGMRNGEEFRISEQDAKKILDSVGTVELA